MNNSIFSKIFNHRNASLSLISLVLFDEPKRGDNNCYGIKSVNFCPAMNRSVILILNHQFSNDECVEDDDNYTKN